MNPNYLTFRKYAKHRGVSPEAVSQAVKAGRIDTVDYNGKRYIDKEDADRKWNQNTDEMQQKNMPDGLSEKTVTYQKARAMREAYQAKLAKLDFEEKSGRLIDAEQVKRDAFELARRVRDSLLNIPSRVASQLTSLTDPVEVEELLENEIRKALKTLADE